MKTKKGKIVIIIKIIFIICIIYNILFLLMTTISKKDYFKMFGISYFSMEDNQMKDDISKNDLVIVKKAESDELQKEDIIAYKINGKTRINKIINVTKDGFVTKSNKNYYPDIEKVQEGEIIGKKIGHVPFAGVILEILQSNITSVFIFIFLILYFFYNKYVYKMKKKRARKKVKRDRVFFFQLI